ncbi:helix-turn-helix domain-containing protein [Cohnella sp. GCM10020058]|uniref:helix-turn-helix domain-containing protein n=1 Tax=Cohnella sp. GCM10020058 TaxID=3317330 RepID=UPI003639BCF4
MHAENRRHTPYYKFKAFLTENEIKQKKVALLLGKSTSALNQNINGTGGDFSLEEIRQICREFNISSDEYFVCTEVSDMKQKELIPSYLPSEHQNYSEAMT